MDGTRQDEASANAREEGAHRREHGRTNGQRPPVRRHPRDAHPRGHTPYGIRGHAEVPSTLEHTPAGGACLQWVQGFLCTHLGECLPPMGYIRSFPREWVRARSAPSGEARLPPSHGGDLCPTTTPFVPPTGGIPSGGALAVRYLCRGGAVTFGDMRNQGVLWGLCLLLGSVEGPAVSVGHAPG